MNAPRDSDEAALMNARKKEKKKQLLLAKKPKTDSDWINLGEDLLKWIKANLWVMDIDDYANAHGYTPYVFKKYWPNENKNFKDYIECAYHILKCRHNNYLDSKDKLYLMIIKERPLYNWELRDYELMMKQKDDENKGNINVTIEAAPDTGLKPAPQKGE